MKANDFDRIAWCYDFLVRMVFGTRLDRASSHFLVNLRTSARVLILGGGTGKLMKNIAHVHEVVYLEKSSKMLEKAKKRSPANVKMLHGDFIAFEESKSFDVVICPFFLDVFLPHELREVLKKIHALLSLEGQVIVTDFQRTTLWSKQLISLMYLFFSKAAHLSGSRLLSIHEMMLHQGFEEIHHVSYQDGMVFSKSYQKILSGNGILEAH